MDKKERIKYRNHLATIGVILIFQFFFCDIFAYFYLNSIEKKLMEKESSLKGELFRFGEYVPIVKKDHRSETPSSYKFVFVRNYSNGNFVKETYYTNHGKKIAVIYIGEKWDSTSADFFPRMASFILPIIGLSICFFSIFHKIVRTGEILSWKIRKYPEDKTEKICFLYGAPIFFGGFFFTAIRQLWFKLPM